MSRRSLAVPRPAKRIPRPARVVQPSPRQIKRGLRRAAAAGAAARAAGTFLRLNTAAAPQEIYYEVSALQSSLDTLQERASMSDVRADIADLESNLTHALVLLESAREKGYVYQKDLEDIAYQAMSRWQNIRGDVESSLDRQTSLLQDALGPIDARVQHLNGQLESVGAASAAMGEVRNAIDQSMGAFYEAERTVESAYREIEAQAYQLTTRLTRIHWALTQRNQASFEFETGEDLYMAVKARWDQAGKDDPEGILFLTNQRLLFERKEKVATKKVLFLATEKELIQALSLNYALGDIKGLKAQNKGVFGHQDFLEVEFPDRTVPYHIDGQDSDDWVRFIKDAQSGKLEEDRAAANSLSYADLIGELNQADLVELQGEVNELQEEMVLQSAREELAGLENQVTGLERELADLRARRYLVEKSLEADVEVLKAQWEKIKFRAEAALEYQTKLLGHEMKAIQTKMAELAGKTGALAAARPLYIELKSMIASAEAQAEAAEAAVLDQYDEYADEVESLDAHFEWVDWMLDALSTASFQLLASESGVAAVEAAWERPGLEAENGILYLTDQRLLWEDRQGDFELKIAVAVSEVDDPRQEVDEGTGEEKLVVDLGANAPIAAARFALSQPVAGEWLQFIGRARSGDYASDRAATIEPGELERIRNAPGQCPNCGAAFTAPVLRGQTEITCEFCGVKTRI